MLIHTAAYWLMLSLRSLAPRNSFWRDAQFDTIRLCLIKVAARVTEMITRIKIALPTSYPYQVGFASLASAIAKPPPGGMTQGEPRSAQPQTHSTHVSDTHRRVCIPLSGRIQPELMNDPG